MTEKENIYVRRGWEVLGPFSAEHVQTLIDTGSLSLTNEACVSGLDEKWKRLRDVVLNASPAVPSDYSPSQTVAESTDAGHDSTDQRGDLQVAKQFTPTARSRLSALASAGKIVGGWLSGVLFLAVLVASLSLRGRTSATCVEHCNFTILRN
jgi:hypothetical protein